LVASGARTANKLNQVRFPGSSVVHDMVDRVADLLKA
jgi:hypothetical protein